MQILSLAVSLLASLAVADITLSELQPITLFSDTCTNAYNTPIQNCDNVHFAPVGELNFATCTRDCLNELNGLTTTIQVACQDAGVTPGSIIAHAFSGDMGNFLCATGPYKTATETPVSGTATNAKATTASSTQSSSITSSSSTSESSTTTEESSTTIETSSSSSSSTTISSSSSVAPSTFSTSSKTTHTTTSAARNTQPAQTPFDSTPFDAFAFSSSAAAHSSRPHMLSGLTSLVFGFILWVKV